MIRLLDENRDEIPLSLPETHGGMPVAEALAHRRSHRVFAAQRPTASQVAQLFWAAQGITEGEQEHRTAPSAGALLPIMIFVIDHSSVYQYEPRMHRLHRVHDRDVRAKLQTAALDQSCVGSAPVCLVVALDCARSVSKYGHRQNGAACWRPAMLPRMFLQVTTSGLAEVPVGAFEDEKVANILRLPPNLRPCTWCLWEHPGPHNRGPSQTDCGNPNLQYQERCDEHNWLEGIRHHPAVDQRLAP